MEKGGAVSFLFQKGGEAIDVVSRIRGSYIILGHPGWYACQNRRYSFNGTLAVGKTVENHTLPDEAVKKWGEARVFPSLHAFIENAYMFTGKTFKDNYHNVQPFHGENASCTVGS